MDADHPSEESFQELVESLGASRRRMWSGDSYDLPAMQRLIGAASLYTAERYRAEARAARAAPAGGYLADGDLPPAESDDEEADGDLPPAAEESDDDEEEADAEPPPPPPPDVSGLVLS